MSRNHLSSDEFRREERAATERLDSAAASRNREVAMYGMSRDYALADMAGYLSASEGKASMAIISALSDVQEMIDRGQGERARQLMNRVKLAVDVWAIR